jgi:hypothetical protein
MTLFTIFVFFYVTERRERGARIRTLMKRKTKSLLVLSLSGFVAMVVLPFAGISQKPALAKGEGKSYTLTLDSSNTVSVSNTVKINAAYSLGVFSSNLSASSGNFGSIAAGGYFGSSTPLYGITSFAANVVSGSLFAYFGRTAWAREQVISSSSFASGSLSSVALETGASYFYLAPGNSGCVIKEIQITYACYPSADQADSNDLFEGATFPENPVDGALNATLSSTAASGSHRSLHLEDSSYGSSAPSHWPSVLLQLKTPLVVREGGRLTLSSNRVSGKNALSFMLYDSSWSKYVSALSPTQGEYGTNLDGISATNSWNSIKTYDAIQPSCPGTYNATTNPYQSSFSVSFIRLTLNVGDASAATSLYLDSLTYDASGETTKASLWSAYNTENLLQDVDYSTSANGALTGRGSSLSFSGVKGGDDAAQLMITPENDVTSFTFASPSLSDGSGHSIASNAISVYAEKYVTINSSSSNEPTSASGAYPDALVPLASYISKGENTITKGHNQGLWFTVAIPSAQTAGTYSGTGTLTLNHSTFSVPFSVKVYEATMPSVVHPKSCFLMWYDQIVNYYGTASTELRKSYYDFLVAHRVMPDGLPDIYEGDAANGYDGFASNFAAMIAGNNAINSYRLTFSKNGDGTLNTTDAQNQLQVLITKNIALWNAGTHVNFFDKLYYYIDDEPTASSYATVASNTRAIKTLKTSLSGALDSYPELKASFLAMRDIVTAAYPNGSDSTSIKNRTALGVSTSSHVSSYYYNEEPSYNDGINTWCPTYEHFQSSSDRSTYATRQKNGEHVWWYGCINPIQPYPTYHTNAPLLPSRLLSWMEYDYGIEGNLYWCADYFSYYNGSSSAIRDVWSNANTWENCYGDGMLVYPGNRYDIAGPISTLRLESVKAAQEDYEYLYLFNQYVDAYNTTYSKSVSSATLLSKYYTNLFSGVETSCTSSAFVSYRDSLLDTLGKMASDLKGTIESL